MKKLDTTSDAWQSLKEKDVNELVRKKKMKLEQHKYGANDGVSLALSVVDGGVYGNKEKGISGSIHWSGYVKNKPLLRDRIIAVVKQLLEDAFGKEKWYQRLVKLTEKLNNDTDTTRTIPGLPISGIWLSLSPKVENMHCDNNVVGSTFLLSTTEVAGGELLGCAHNGCLIKHHLKEGEVVAGKWAQYGQCNDRVKEKNVKKRSSFTIYLDRRVFNKRLVYVEPKNFIL